MEKLVILLVMLMSFFVGFSQNIDSVEVSNKQVEKETEGEEVFTIVESMPFFEGGDHALPMYLYDNLVYPQEAKEKGIQGKVYVNFIVGKNGVVKDAKVIRGVHELLDNEALRLVT